MVELGQGVPQDSTVEVGQGVGQDSMTKIGQGRSGQHG